MNKTDISSKNANFFFFLPEKAGGKKKGGGLEVEHIWDFQSILAS